MRSLPSLPPGVSAIFALNRRLVSHVALGCLLAVLLDGSALAAPPLMPTSTPSVSSRPAPCTAISLPARSVPGPEPVTLAALPFRGKLILRGGADVQEGAADERSSVRLNGRQAISAGVIRQATANPLEVAAGVREVIPKIQQDLPPGIKLPF